MTDVGDLIRFGNYSDAEDANGVAAEAFTILDGTPTDPASVILTVQRPDGTQLDYGWPSAGLDGTLIRESAGRFYADIEIDQSGTWLYRLVGIGAVTAAAEGRLRVQRQRVVT